MSRLLPLLFVIALLLQAASVGAPVPKETKKALVYFPDKVGAKWVYDLDGKEETETVTAVKKEDESILVTVHKVEESGRETDRVTKVTESGLFIVSGLAVKHPPSHVLKLPHKAGSTWKTWTGAWLIGKSEYTATGPEEVVVPAGKYDAIRVGCIDDGNTGDGDIYRTYWYAPDVGLVKYVYDFGKFKYTRTLKSFTR